MNILHVAPYYPPAWAFGGVVRSVAGLAEAQAAAGNAVFVLTTDALDRKRRLEAGNQRLNGVSVTRVANVSGWLRGRLNLSSPMGFRRAAAELMYSQGIDLVHCHELRTVENWMAALAAHRLDVPLVVSPHGTLPDAVGKRLAKRLWDMLISRRFVHYFDRVIALTPQEAHQVKSLWTALGIPLGAAQVRVVPNGVILPDAAPADLVAAFRRIRGLSSGPTVLFAGRLAARKRPALLLSAFGELLRALPEAQLLMVGPDEGEAARLRRQARELGLGTQVVFTGLLTGDELEAAYHAADLFVLPSRGEGLPMAALEALAHGLPVILAEDCGLSGALEAGAAMIAGPDSSQLARAMSELLADPARRHRMAERAREVAGQAYTWPQVTAQIMAIYREVVGKPRERTKP